ncbi:hypothetical protein M0R45_003548 [Rubus argutus]|uniref:Uncharacterized protein n=1 Tax=Rubus argutus TaxID=59490 RepID=A0AAW1YIM8_RUBAR
MEGTRKRPGGDVTESELEPSTKRRRDHAEKGGGDITPPPVNDVVFLDTSDETLSEFARLLDSDYRSWTAASAPARVTFSADPYKTPKVFQTMSTSYVTINGNEESCGSSFSDAESSVMASVDTTGRDIEQVRLDYEWYEAEKWAEGVGECGFDDGAWEVSEEEAARGGVELNLDMDWDDDALARFVGEDLN